MKDVDIDLVMGETACLKVKAQTYALIMLHKRVFHPNFLSFCFTIRVQVMV